MYQQTSEDARRCQEYREGRIALLCGLSSSRLEGEDSSHATQAQGGGRPSGRSLFALRHLASLTEDPAMPRSAAFLRLRANVLSVIHDIPAGRVTTYGTIAEYLGITPRDVARVLSGLSEAESE